MKILGLCGSLRRASINAALLRAAKRLAPAGVQLDLNDSLGELPLFNPDLEDDAPASVRRFRERVAAADALLFASPEYAHGVTGSIKNALDWLVSFEPFAGKAVAVLNASPRAHHADEALRETLKTMAAVLVEPACVAIPLLGSGLDEEGMVNAAAVASAIRRSLASLKEAAVRRNTQASTFLLQ